VDIKIDLNLNAPELVEAIKSLKEVIAAQRQCSDTPDESPNITMETVRAKLAVLAQSGKQEQVKALLQKFGASRLSDLDPAHYEAVLQEAEEIR